MTKHLHLLGICGTFMGGLAIIARQLGFKVTGSDQNVYPPMSDTLRQHGIEILEGYDPKHLQPHPDCVVIGNVCSRGNPAVEYVLNEGISYVSAAQWLYQEVLSKRHVLAVSGTHGKTTTTSMLTWILQQAGLKPGYLIGGVANDFSTTAELGESPYFVIEADEYDSAFFDKRPKFLHYRASTLIINNIEFDHADIYADLAAIQQQFQYLLRTVPGKGLILTPEADANVQSVLQAGSWSRQSFFTGPNAAWQYKLLNTKASAFEVYFKGDTVGQVQWRQLGEYNVENAMAALAAAVDVGVDANVALQALSTFTGVKRRLEVVGRANDITVYDDFAHHPTAIKKTLQALRAKVGDDRIVAVVQFASNTMKAGKHDYSELANALQTADRVALLQPESKAFNTEMLCQALTKPVQVYSDVAEIVDGLKKDLNPKDSVLIMSNAGFGGLHKKLLSSL